MSPDWTEIEEWDKTNTLKIKEYDINKEKRIVFVKAKDSLGSLSRRFVGVFVLYKIDEDGKRYYKKIADALDLSKYFVNSKQ